jgi:predicted transcriptional regulator
VRLVRTTVNLPVETIEALDRIAGARGTIRSVIIREALAEYVERHTAEAREVDADESDIPTLQGRP